MTVQEPWRRFELSGTFPWDGVTSVLLTGGWCMKLPDLLSIQMDSYREFVERLEEIIKNSFPWELSVQARQVTKVTFKVSEVRLAPPPFDEAECFSRKFPYQYPILVTLNIADDNTCFPDVLLGFIPALTSRVSLFYGKDSPRERVAIAQIVPRPEIRLARKVKTLLTLAKNKDSERINRLINRLIDKFNKINNTEYTLNDLNLLDISINLKNYQIRLIGDLFADAVSKTMSRLKSYFKRIRLKNFDEVKYFVIPSLPDMFTRLFEHYLDRTGLIQLLDKTNPLAEVSHKRKVTFCGLGGIRDLHGDKPEREVHPSHFGRLCPLETPESVKIGLNLHFALGARVEKGVIKSCYQDKSGNQVYLSPEDEEKDCIIAPSDYDHHKLSKKNDTIVCEEPTHREIAHGQFLGAASALIPFISHDDMNRAMMGAKFMKQALPLLHCEPPLIKTGLETKVGRESRLCVIAEKDGTIKQVSQREIVVHYDGEERERHYPLVPVPGVLPGIGSFYRLPSNIAVVSQFDGVVETVSKSKVKVESVDTQLRMVKTYQIPDGFKVCVERGAQVKEGQVLAYREKVCAGDVLADSAATVNGELALGVNLLVAYMPWYGWNFEDAVVVSEEAAEKLTSLHLEPQGDGGFKLVTKKLEVGDKIANRHGNKGVVSNILPKERMPRLKDGTCIDIILNPHGVISRMNIGQLLETHWGWIAKKRGEPLTFPPFCRINLDDLDKALRGNGLPDGKAKVSWTDEKGETHEAEVVVGYQYIMKLNHLAEDKFHVRTTGQRTLITLQPPKGKKRDGGQRLGEMEVWALQAHKAERVLEELLTYRSDVLIEPLNHGPFLPESFRALVMHLRGLGIDVRLIVHDQRGNCKEFPIENPRQKFDPKKFVRLEIALAGEDQIKRWSRGEVKDIRYEEKRYRCSNSKCEFKAYEDELKGKKLCLKCYSKLEVELAPSREGLFGSKIFGDEKNRERMGHIELACSIPHPLDHSRDLKILPVIPPAYRPRLRDVIGGLSDYYQRILYWNNQLKLIMSKEGFESRRNRVWAELVRAIARLFGVKAHIRGGKISYKTLPRSERRDDLRSRLEGKTGLLRGFLLGKRVDFSGRAVIVPDPTLPFGCFRLPWEAASKIYNHQWGGHDLSEKAYKAGVEKRVGNSIFLLNRAPTLHRYNIQAFKPAPQNPFWEHKVIAIHPLICGVYNADFDGDTMAFYYLEGEAAKEAEERMSPIRHLFSVANGNLNVHLAQDIVSGIYLLTLNDEGRRCLAELLNQDSLTVCGSPVDKNTLREAVEKYVRSQYSIGKSSKVPDVLDQVMRLGFKVATEKGLSFSVFDLPVLPATERQNCFSTVKSITDEQERTEVLRRCCGDKILKELRKLPPEHPIAVLVLSGARGDKLQLARIGGAVIAKENVPLSCYVEGLSSLEYFFASMYARQEMMDKKLGPAVTGYLTRKLVYCAYPVTIVCERCNDTEGLRVPIEPVRRLVGRVVAKGIDGILSVGQVIEHKHLEDLEKLKARGLSHIWVFSPFTCTAEGGVCQRCYGWDLSQPDGKFPEIGLPVGVIAAQSIGERGTQEMMRTFHGTARGIVSNVLKVKEIFDKGSKGDLEELIQLLREAYENSVDDKHFEIILKQMKQVSRKGNLRFRSLLKVARSRKDVGEPEHSFLAAALFDSSFSVLRDAAVRGLSDTLWFPAAKILLGFRLN